MGYNKIVAIVVKGLIWDDWNKQHIAEHDISVDEVEEVCHGKYKTIESYRKRIQLLGSTRKGRLLMIILSPETRDLIAYKKGIYYPITAFEEEVNIK